MADMKIQTLAEMVRDKILVIELNEDEVQHFSRENMDDIRKSFDRMLKGENVLLIIAKEKIIKSIKTAQDLDKGENNV